MPIPSNAIIISQVKAAMLAEGFDLTNAPLTDKFVEILVENIVNAIKLATVSTTVTTVVIGTLPAGPVAASGTGAGTGGIS